MKSEELLKLTPGTAVIVTPDNGEKIIGKLTFQVIPVNELINAQQLLEQYAGDESALEYYDQDAYDIYIEYNDSFVYGISFLQQEDYNVEPRDIGKPWVRKGTPVVCYEYRADEYKLNLDDG